MQHSMENNLVTSNKRRSYRYELNQLIPVRMEMIRNLRERDYKQYEWLLERLDLQFKPKPEKEYEIMVTRKEGLRQLTKTYCEDVNNKKLEAYRAELEGQQVPFLEQKLKNLQFIRAEQFALKVPVTISQQQIDDVQKEYDIMKADYDAKKVAPTKKKWKVY